MYCLDRLTPFAITAALHGVRPAAKAPPPVVVPELARGANNAVGVWKHTNSRVGGQVAAKSLTKWDVG